MRLFFPYVTDKWQQTGWMILTVYAANRNKILQTK